MKAESLLDDPALAGSAAHAGLPMPAGEAVPLFLAPAEREAIHRQVVSLPIVAHLGMEVEIRADGAVEARLPRIEPYHLGGHDGGALNGAILLGLLYCAIICPGLANFRGARCATLQFDSRMLKPVQPRSVRAVGYAYSATRKIAFCRASVLDADNEPRSLATGIVIRV